MPESAASLSLDQREYALGEAASAEWRVSGETANQLTHGLGFVLSLAAATVMFDTVWRHADGTRTVGCLIYMVSLVALYAASTLSHSFADPARRTFYRTLDQVCIFLMMAGNYTPFGLMHMSEGAWPLILIAMWALVSIGIFLRISRGEGAVTFLFFAMIGWLPGLALGEVYHLSGVPGLGLVLGGGLAYTLGLWFLTNDHRHPYLHAVWHLLTITGSACHFLFVQWYVAEWPLV